MVTGEDIISGKMAGERYVRVSEIIRSRFLGISRKNKESGKDRNEVAHKEEAHCGLESLKKIHCQHSHLFSKR